ncbi:MAG: hypothetical protein IK038_06735 [Bacteroidaceae bacterium]|nr:hypothetical protein [Bacteroidaceae bacterium]
MRENNVQSVAGSSRHFFENGMRGHSAVMNIDRLEGDVYLIERTDDRPDLRIIIADIYIAGEADIMEILYEHPGIDCIVLVGFYNRYSIAAKEYATINNVGLYDNREFFGAVNCVGRAFINYKRKEK